MGEKIQNGNSCVSEQCSLHILCGMHRASPIPVSTTNNLQFPLDSVKTRMQTYKYDNFTDCVRHTYKTERIRGFFRGVTAPLASVTLVRTISFSVYQRSKYTYAGWFKRNFGFDPLLHINTPGTYPTLSTLACFAAAGATAGSFITLVACELYQAMLGVLLTVLRSFRIDKIERSGVCPYGRTEHQKICFGRTNCTRSCQKLPEQGHIPNRKKHCEESWNLWSLLWVFTSSV